jgi:hypothetical protein
MSIHITSINAFNSVSMTFLYLKNRYDEKYISTENYQLLQDTSSKHRNGQIKGFRNYITLPFNVFFSNV